MILKRLEHRSLPSGKIRCDLVSDGTVITLNTMGGQINVSFDLFSTGNLVDEFEPAESTPRLFLRTVPKEDRILIEVTRPYIRGCPLSLVKASRSAVSYYSCVPLAAPECP
jgi:hypothetical protein